jgi:hypothetical protein
MHEPEHLNDEGMEDDEEEDSPQLGLYCKAYLVKELAQFSGWKANWQGNLSEKVDWDDDGEEVEIPRNGLEGDDVVFLQENYVVTDDIYKDRFILFDKVSEEWKSFCHEVLKFRIPPEIEAMVSENKPQQAFTNSALF